MEDLDPPREIKGASTRILEQLNEHGLHSDDKPVFQSSRLAIYREYLQRLSVKNLVYPCDCSRRRIREIGGLYDGHCRNKSLQSETCAIRVIVDEDIEWVDLIQGQQNFQAEKLGGDFVVKRRDGLYSYQLAVAVDDALQGITRVIRGADLLDSTARQLAIQKCLELPTPDYGHLPMAMKADGHKLSKQTGAQPLDSAKARQNLCDALSVLGQRPPPPLSQWSISDILDWGVDHWNLTQVPRTSAAFFK